MKKQIKTIKVIEPIVEGGQVENLLNRAIEKGTPVETIERLLAMRRELKAEWAKEQFDNAMAKFQGECPVIKKLKAGGKTNSGQVAYYYAPLEVIVEQVKGLLQGNGFSYSIQTITTATGVKVTCAAKHKAGHSESSEVELPLSTRTNVMSAPQVVAATLTFAKRYAFCNVFGILTGDDDNDATIQTEKTGKENICNKAIRMIRGVGDPIALDELKSNIKKSEKYSKEEKVIIFKEIDGRIKELISTNEKK